MFPRRFLVIAIGLALLFGLLFVVPSMQRDAWMQGYLMGQLASGKDAGSAALLVPTMMRGGPGFGGPGVFLLIPLGILFFVGLGKFMRFRAWQHGYGPGGWGHHGPPPWAQGQPPQPGQAQPQTPDQPQGQPPQPGQPGTPPWGQGTPPWAAWQQPPWGPAPTPPQPPQPPHPGASDM